MTAHADPAPAHGGPDRAHDHHRRHRAARRVVVVLSVLVVVTAVIVLALVLVHRHNVATERSARENELAKGQRLAVAKVELSEARRDIDLPGEVRGFNQATLYAKATGYVREMRVDRGDRVKKDAILAVIESPELQQDVLSAKSNRIYAQRTAERLEFLAKPGVVSALDRDNAVNARQRATADEARAQSLLEYTLVRAPFDGVVTARYVDPGALVPAANGGTQAAQPVVDVSDLDRVRVFVYIGQDAAPFVKPGDAVTLMEEERPAQRVPATMTRVAGALDPRTRTMQCEIDLDNRPWHLIPGTFVRTKIAVAIPPSPLVPNEGIVVRDGGKPHVAIVDGNKVHYRAVEILSNDGRTTRIARGLQGGEMIGINVPVQLQENETVQTVPAGSTGVAKAEAQGVTPQDAGH